ncbi:conserved hypothetical protein [Gammaproteobacteria bacterium]
MLNTLEKLKRLEAYIAVDGGITDSVLDKTLIKIFVREKIRMRQLTQRLQQEIKRFEQDYHLLSQEFYTRYNQGEMGDEIDFIEWAATLEMLVNAEKRIALLDIIQ